MSELVSVCACVRVLAWASSLADSLIARLLTDSLSPAFLLSSFFRTPDFCSHRVRDVQQYMRKAHQVGKKREKVVGLRKGGTSVSTFPYLNFFLHSWQQSTVSSQGEVGLEKENGKERTRQSQENGSLLYSQTK